MLRVGLTGGLACGKSSMAKVFASLGAHVFHADLVAHELMKPGQPVYDEVVQHFGREILRDDGTIDRAKLSRLAFGGGRVNELNKLVHPAVISKQEEWLAKIGEHETQGIALVEAALIFEAGVMRRFDKLIVVVAREEQKIERFAARVCPQGTPEALAAAREEARRRIAAQVPDSIKIESADFLIDNSGTIENAEAQVRKIFTELRRLAESIS